MNQDEMKTQVGRAALEFVVDSSLVGVGTGSTVNRFIDALGTRKDRIAGAVSSSAQSTARLQALGIRVFDANEVERLPVYIDGADEIDGRGCMLKGGGAALTREKIVADLSDRFVCIADASKRVAVLGKFPLPVEVIAMARSHVGREMLRRKAQPVLRENFKTDNGNLILDCHGLTIMDPPALEAELNGIAGVVTNGLFARRGADVILVGSDAGVRTLDAHKF